MPKHDIGHDAHSHEAMHCGNALDLLKRKATKKTLAGMSRYGIPSDDALGVAVGDIRAIAKHLGRNHPLALELWQTGIYEARMLACFVDDPKCVEPKQMDAWCADFDSWAICDTACFHLWDRTPHAWKKVDKWSKSKREFVKRAAFALLASLALHDKQADDELFARRLSLITTAADDGRNFVKKGVSWALRGIGHRSAYLHSACLAVAEKLASSENVASRWIGKDALKDLSRHLVETKLKRSER
jgi:3-methyladenine DNA glycosylase AlkD